MNSFFFYDIETSGLNLSFDQVLQFAAIRTDNRFKEVERRNLAIRLRPDIIPSPKAALTHRIPLDSSTDGQNELDATILIHRWLNQPGTVSLGYNTLGFDDPFLRFAFYRNLLSPYTHQYANGCRRMDLLPMAVLYRLYRPEGLNWPMIDGQPSLKLEHLSHANHLTTGPAHDAMADVEATVALARRFFESPEVWQYLADGFDKNEDIRRTTKLPEALPAAAAPLRLGILAASEFGPDAEYQVPALLLGKSRPYPNQSLWLRLDQENLTDTTAETVAENTWVVRKKLGEPPFLLPPLERFWNRLPANRGRMAKEQIGWLKAQPDLIEAIVTYHREYRYPDIPNLDLDASLYQEGFFTRREETWCHRFHTVLPGERVPLIDQAPTPRTRQIALRILLRNDPEIAGKRLARHRFDLLEKVNPAHADEAMVDYRGEKRTTPAAALAEIDGLKQENNRDREQQEILAALETYIKSKFPAPE
jgi:exodeoxyribonuclease I